MNRYAAAIEAAGHRYYRLVLLTGPPRSGKTQILGQLSTAEGWPRLNLNLFLSRALLDLTGQQRQLQVVGCRRELASQVRGLPAHHALSLDGLGPAHAGRESRHHRILHARTGGLPHRPVL